MFKSRRFGDDRMGGGGFAPIKVGDEVEVNIEAVGEKGDGIAKIKGFVIFVPGTKQGENVKIKINKVLRKVGFGEVVGKGTGEAKQETTEGSEESTEEPSYETETTEDSETVEDSEEF